MWEKKETILQKWRKKKNWSAANLDSWTRFNREDLTTWTHIKFALSWFTHNKSHTDHWRAKIFNTISLLYSPPRLLRRTIARPTLCTLHHNRIRIFIYIYIQSMIFFESRQKIDLIPAECLIFLWLFIKIITQKFFFKETFVFLLLYIKIRQLVIFFRVRWNLKETQQKF